ncbi:DNA-directed DNA polymerase [Bertholletia excelsa]
MLDDIETYIQTCLICQHDKMENKVGAKFLQPLPIPNQLWEAISLDFIIGLPRSEGCQTILVVVDRLTKYATFIPTTKECPVEEATHLFLKQVVKFWGLPKNISDKDPRFTGRCWSKLFHLLGSQLCLSTSMHSQTYGQIKRANAMLELYLCHYTSATQANWVKLLDIAQFSFNLQRNKSPGRRTFELVTGQQLLTPTNIASGYKRNCPAAHRMAWSWQTDTDMVKACFYNMLRRR